MSEGRGAIFSAGLWWRDAGLRAVIISVILAYGLLSVRAIPLWDGAFYYAYLRSAVVDGDWDFGNDIRLIGERSEDPLFGTLGMDEARTPTGRIRNTFPIGSAWLWSPLYIVLHAGMSLLAPAGADGLTVPYTWLISGMGAAFALLGMALTYSACRRRFSRYGAALGTMVAWLAAPLLHYAFREPAYSHVASAFMISLFFWLWWRDDKAWTPARSLLLGAVIGAAALVRPQNILYLLLPAGELVGKWWSAHRAARAKPSQMTSIKQGTGSPNASPLRVGLQIGLLILIALIVFTPQMATWKLFYGSPFTVPQDVDFQEMQGHGFIQWLSPALGQTLFSSFHGLFTWQPAALLGVVGLALFWRRDRWRVTLMLAGIALQVYLVASAGDWFGGGGFGPRRMDSLTPFLALGLAALVDLSPRRIWRWATGVVAGLLIAGNWVLMMVAWPAGIGGETGLALAVTETGLGRFYKDWLGAAGLGLQGAWRLVSRDAPFYRLAFGIRTGTIGQVLMGVVALSLPFAVAAAWLALGGLAGWLWNSTCRHVSSNGRVAIAGSLLLIFAIGAGAIILTIL